VFRRGLPLLPLFLAAAAGLADEKPLPLSRTVILPSGGTYFVEGRREIAIGQELSVQKGTRITGRGTGATLVVSGALQVRGIDGAPVTMDGLAIEVAERCERVHLETVELSGCPIRTPKDLTSEARVHLEEVDLLDSPLELRLTKGEVTVLNSRVKSPVRLVAVDEEGKARPVVRALVNGCNLDRELQAEGIPSLVVRGCGLYGSSVVFKDCEDLTFDANVVRGPSVLFEQSKAGGFRKTILQKSDFHGVQIVFRVPREEKQTDRIPVDKCWFQGRTKKDEILGRDIKDGHTDETTGAFVVFRKINERELKLGGTTTAGGGVNR
jgi:hypothetical protein